MIRNLSLLFVLVVLMILGLAWYHYASISTMKTQPLTLYHWADTSAKMNVKAVSQITDFQLDNRKRLNYGYTESIHWFRFQLSAQNVPKSLSLEIKTHTINELELFANEVSLGKTGDKFPFAQRPTPTKTFVYPIYVDAYQSGTYYLKIDKRFENLVTEINLWNTSDFEDQEQRIYLLWGIFLGVVALVVLLNFFFWISTRDQVYLWYGLYVIGLLMRQLADSGLSFQYLWANYPQFNYPEPLVQALWFYLPAELHFQQRFLDLHSNHKKLFWATQCLKYSYWTGFALLIVTQIFPIPKQFILSHYVITTSHALVAPLLLIVFFCVVFTHIKSDDKVKKLYAYGFLIQIIIQTFVLVQATLRNKSDGIFFIDAYILLLIVFMIDLVLFSYLLAYRYRKSATDNQSLALNLAKTQQNNNQKIIEVLASEREQVQQLLHAQVGTRLSETLQLLKNAPSSVILSDSEQMIEKVNNDLSKIAQNTLPLELIEKGLSASLNEIVEKLNKTQSIIFDFDVKGKVFSLSINQEIQLFRIANELINNILKHSKATKAQLQLVYEEKHFSLLVKDDGQGFDTTQFDHEKQGIGLKNLYSRSQEMNGDVEIDSDEKGTEIRVEVPIRGTGF